MEIEDIRKELIKNADKKYRDFMSSLLPTVDKNTVLGVKTPILRKMASEICKKGSEKSFLLDLPHKYYEENNLHGFIIEKISDFDMAVFELERFLKYIDNWGTCDSLSSKSFKTHRDELYEYIKKWLSSTHTYTVRFGIVTLMKLYLGQHYKPHSEELIINIKSNEYYVNMARAWYFASFLTKNYDRAVWYIENKTLDDFTHNKAIQKATESLCITKDKKEYLKKFKIK